jgi:transposase
LSAKAVIADKGCDADTLVQTICMAEVETVIPPRSNRIWGRRGSDAAASPRMPVERFFNRIKHFRRTSTQYDKLADSYLIFASLAWAFEPRVKMWTGPNLRKPHDERQA